MTLQSRTHVGKPLPLGEVPSESEAERANEPPNSPLRQPGGCQFSRRESLVPHQRRIGPVGEAIRRLRDDGCIAPCFWEILPLAIFNEVCYDE